MDARLLVSLSGITPKALYRCTELAVELDDRGVPLSMLFTPRAGDGAAAATEWMRTRAGRGDEVLLHGYDHRVTPSHHAVRLRRKAEFAALPAHEARLRLIAASAALERAGLRAEGFAPPRWLVSRGTLDALRERGFSLCADLSAVRDLRSDSVHRARVQGFGSATGTETVRCFALVLSAARTARRGGLVRLGVDAADLERPGRRQAFLDAVDAALEAGAAGTTYAGALTAARPPASAAP
ncbi:DUF2334 domain-containing protein [Amycolatopsis aidingensis]|uniref:DUF2334 domain-containing protein n=1 Tax=Amycolatopsis aidingensis TaxID=2842453 RepID=UPI001C0C906A|nr:DUF2334 domain-containing protein [Amycolatopsis aidingensis]